MPSIYTIRCATCAAVNRVSSDKAGVMGRCGACGKQLPILYDRPVAMDDTRFDQFINSYRLPVLAEFWAPWCAHCTAYAPVVREIAKNLAGRAAVVQVNTQENSRIAARLGVRGIPVIFMFINGQLRDQLAGVQTREAVLAMVSRHESR